MEEPPRTSMPWRNQIPPTSTSAIPAIRRIASGRLGCGHPAGPAAGREMLRREELVQHLDRDRALAHRRRHAFHRAPAHVAGREHAGHARLEREPRARARPDGVEVETGEDEALLV